MTARAVLFDLDETLFDHRRASMSSLGEIQQEHPRLLAAPLTEIEAAFYRILDQTFPAVLSGEVTPEQSRVHRIRLLFEEYGAPLTEQRAEELALIYRQTYQESRYPVAGVKALLEVLHGRAQIGIVTNNFTAEQQDKLRCCALDHLIDFLVTSEDVGAGKPDPRMFQAALDQAACGPREAVMVGDSWSSDVMGAHRAGIRAVWFNRTGAEMPVPGMVEEIRSLEPAEAVVSLLLA